MRRFVLIAALALASASAQAGDSRSLSTGVTTNDPPAAINYQVKSGPRHAETDSTAMPAPASPTPAVETPRYAPPPAETPVQTPTQTPVQTQTPRYTARPAPVDTTPTDAAANSTRQHMPPRDARYRRGRVRHAGYLGSSYGSGYGRPHFRMHHWSTRRIIAALHRYGIYW